MATTRSKLKSGCKAVMNGCAVVVTWPCAVMCWLQEAVQPGGEEMFRCSSQCLALVPGLLGVYLRRGFYRQTLESCAGDVFIGFGSLFTHRQARAESGVYVGNYAMIGCVVLRARCLIGSRASLLSGGQLHTMNEQGDWTAADDSRRQQIEIGENAWLGEAAVVMANVGARAMVSAGAVVAAPVPERVMVAGNPARFVKRLDMPGGPSEDAEPRTSSSSSPTFKNGSATTT